MDGIRSKKEIIILGAGLAGLSAGYILSKAGRSIVVFEGDSAVGGLSKTISYHNFRFDLGGHRFLTKNKKIEHFVKDLLAGEFLTVPRKSKIYMRNRFFDYPLKPSNAIFGLGIYTTLKAIFDYSKEKIKGLFASPVNVSLEDWVVSNFGRTMFNLYFKEYSEKVWGIECNKISQEWVERRIKGLSMGAAIKNSFFKFSNRDIDTLADKFIYPSMGIGQISDRLKEEIEQKNPVITDTKITQINHENFLVKSVTAKNCDDVYDIEGREFVSSIPLTSLIKILKPTVPDEILEAASKLKYRDLVIVAIMLNRERVTELTWMYIPEQKIPIGRIHEPKNWSPHMAPDKKTHIVTEYFCFEGDKIWNSDDEELISATVEQLERFDFINKVEVIDTCVVRVPKAYPLLEVGYSEHYRKILEYLDNFKNLHIAGRGGMFRYYNIDHVIESGFEAAEDILCKGAQDKKNSISRNQGLVFN